MRRIVLGLWIVCVTVVFFAVPCHAQRTDPVVGLWYTEGNEGGVQLYPCGEEICGRLYWLKDAEENGDVSRDTKNPDESKRERPLCRLQFMEGFVPDGEGHYTDGSIYSPRHGADFSAEMTLIDHDTLDLHGYILIPLFGQSQIWKRAAKMPRCATTIHHSVE